MQNSKDKAQELVVYSNYLINIIQLLHPNLNPNSWMIFLKESLSLYTNLSMKMEINKNQVKGSAKLEKVFHHKILEMS